MYLFLIVLFADACRIRINPEPTRRQLDSDQLRMFAMEGRTDVAGLAHIIDYGAVRQQYRVPELIISMMAETLIVGAASGWIPLIMAAAAGSELITDVPFWC